MRVKAKSCLSPFFLLCGRQHHRGEVRLYAAMPPASELIGKAVVLTDRKASTVENVWLDESHGLRISIKGHDGRWPISTIKFTQN